MSNPLSRPLRRGGAPAAGRTLLAGLLLASGAGHELAAQPRVGAATDSITRRIQHITPTSGPPGTVVKVESGLMPHITPVRIGIGATRTGFESLAELLTSATGEFSVDVTVPQWAQRERNHRFIVFDFYFSPIALSEPFLVTDENGRVEREGWITDELGGCVAMRDTDGELFTLVGNTGAVEEGDRVIVEGTVAEASTCEQGPTIRIVRLQVDPGGA